MSEIKAVIMAGGSGTRLWPLSRAAHPKQFLALHGDDSMLQATVKRLSDLNVKSTLTICNEEHRFFVAEQLREIEALGQIILEPVGRNTAPAIALAALTSNENELLLVLAADHVIQDQDAFTKAVADATPLAEAGKLVTFGVVADKPHTGYGYIKKGAAQSVGFTVDKFVEKPSIELAKEYIGSGEYYWNSGIFLIRAGRYLSELKKFRPDIYEACKLSVEEVVVDLDFIRIDSEKFCGCPSESVDYAVMEKTEEAVIFPMNAGWSDLGSWGSLWEISEKDAHGNAVSGDVQLDQVQNSYVRSEDKLLAVIGVDDLVVVSTKDVVLVAKKDRVQDVKKITDNLKLGIRKEWEMHREVCRPWGKFDSIDRGKRYQVKRITVKPGGKLSVQSHRHRSEHWVVVAGTATVRNEDRVYRLHKNESTFIPIGAVHSLENNENVELELIEIQSGDYLGEDDIVRYNDVYGRV